MPAFEQVILETMEVGESVHVVAGSDPDTAYQYDFIIVEKGEQPICELVQTSPDGTVVGPGRAIVQGAGRWTTERQNPMQRADWFVGRPYQEKALTIGYGVLFVGGLIVLRDPNKPQDIYRLEPACTQITRET